MKGEVDFSRVDFSQDVNLPDVNLRLKHATPLRIFPFFTVLSSSDVISGDDISNPFANFTPMAHLLDNPVWEALSSLDSHYNSGTDTLKYYPENMSPFVGLQNWDESDLHSLIAALPSNRSFSIMKVIQPRLPSQFQIIFSLPLFQLVCADLKPYTNPSHHIQKLESKDIPQMLELTAKTKPGPFYEKTIDFGNYLGIYSGDALIAMAGERLHLTGYTEVSAICTHPDYLGNGYASSLTSMVCKTIIANGETPFLHVRQDNTRAIDMYKRLGFEIRSEVYFAVIKKSEEQL